MAVGGLFPGREGAKRGGGGFSRYCGAGGLGKVDVFFLAGGVDGNEAGLVEGVCFFVDPDWNNGDARGGLEEGHDGVSRTLDCVVPLTRDFRLLHGVDEKPEEAQHYL